MMSFGQQMVWHWQQGPLILNTSSPSAFCTTNAGIHKVHLNKHASGDISNKLCYRRRTARRAMSGSILSTTVEQVVQQLLLLLHTFNCPFSGTIRVSRYQKGKTNQDFTEARDSEWQWHQLGSMQVCTSLQTDNHASTPPLSFFTGRVLFLPHNQQRQSTEGLSCTTNPQQIEVMELEGYS